MIKQKILVVDDESRMRKLVGDFLHIKGFEVLEAADGRQAVDIFSQNQEISLIILDVMMPNMDGIETFQEMQKLQDNLNKQTPVIMLTANAISGMEEQYLSQGFHGYLTKPLDGNKLKQLLWKKKYVMRYSSTNLPLQYVEALQFIQK